MGATRTLVSIAAAAAIALAAVVVLSNSPAGSPRSALAGPCTSGPDLNFSDDDVDDPPLSGVVWYGAAGEHSDREMVIFVEPDPFPEGKPPITIEIVGVPGDPEIFNDFSPSSGGGSFLTDILTSVDASVTPGIYEYEIRIDCHGDITTIPFDVYVDVCPANGARQTSGFSGQSAPDCGGGHDDLPTPTPEPTATPANATWGDNNCSKSVDPADSLFVLRGDAGLSTNTGDCPEMGADIEVLNASPHIWGDVDCSGAMTPVDSLKTLRFDAGLSVSQEAGCPAIGGAVTIIDAFVLTSDAFAPGGTIPVQHTCDGANTSPQLSWSGQPAGTESLAVIVTDVDGNDFAHWLVYDLPAETTSLPADAELPAGAKEGMTTFGAVDYRGPCPPPGPAHEYVFILCALDAPLNLAAGASVTQLEAAIAGHILEMAELTAFYAR